MASFEILMLRLRSEGGTAGGKWGPRGSGTPSSVALPLVPTHRLFDFQKELDYECWLGEILDKMLIWFDLPNFVRLDLIALRTLINLILCIECHRYWSWDAESELCYLTRSFQAQVFGRRHIIEIFAILSFPLEVYVPVPN